MGKRELEVETLWSAASSIKDTKKRAILIRKVCLEVGQEFPALRYSAEKLKVIRNLGETSAWEILAALGILVLRLEAEEVMRDRLKMERETARRYIPIQPHRRES